jgi:hypothetical protein
MRRTVSVIALVLTVSACGRSSDTPVGIAASSSKAANPSTAASATTDVASVLATAEQASTTPAADGSQRIPAEAEQSSATPAADGSPDPVVVLDVSGTSKVRSDSFDAVGDWAIHAEMADAGDLIVTLFDSTGAQVARTDFSAPSGDTFVQQTCRGCYLEIESFDAAAMHNPSLPSPAYRVVVTDLPG